MQSEPLEAVHTHGLSVAVPSSFARRAIAISTRATYTLVGLFLFIFAL